MKRKVLFVIHRMSVGGSQKSLVNALLNLDYEKYDVTLYVREPYGDLLVDVPKQVKVIINQYDKDYENNAIKLKGKLAIKIRKKSSFVNRLCKKIEKHSFEKMIEKKSQYERMIHPELQEEYDIATSYIAGNECRFTYDYINARKKICFHHISGDNMPELHHKYLPKYDKIVTMAQEISDFLLDKYPELKDKIVEIPNYINVTDILERSKEDALQSYKNLRIHSNKLMLCTCGRLCAPKGSFLALETAKLLKQEGLDFVWVFIGDGAIHTEMKKKIEEYDLADNIIMTGLQMNPYPYIRMSDIYVQPSLEESQCLAIVEAQILGIPVVTTDTIGGHNMVKNRKTGIVVPIDAAELSHEIIYLAQDAELFSTIKQNLSKIDLTEYNAECKRRWDALLDGV